jgi:hypothetical protein
VFVASKEISSDARRLRRLTRARPPTPTIPRPEEVPWLIR